MAKKKRNIVFILPIANPQISLPIMRLGRVVPTRMTMVPMIAITSNIIIAFLIPLIISMIYLLKSAPSNAPRGMNAVIRAVLSV